MEDVLFFRVVFLKLKKNKIKKIKKKIMKKGPPPPPPINKFFTKLVKFKVKSSFRGLVGCSFFSRCQSFQKMFCPP